MDYGAPLYAQPDYDILKCPRYGTDDVWCLWWGADNVAIFDTSLAFLGDHTLTAKIHHFRESGWVIAELHADIEWLKNWKWQAGCIQEVSIHHLEHANALEQLDRAQADHHMHAIKCADTVVHRGRHS